VSLSEQSLEALLLLEELSDLAKEEWPSLCGEAPSVEEAVKYEAAEQLAEGLDELPQRQRLSAEWLAMRQGESLQTNE